MAHLMREGQLALPRIAASALDAGAPVFTSASAADEVVPVTAVTERPLGVAVATAATYGLGVAVQVEGVVKCVAGDTIAQGDLLQIAAGSAPRLVTITAAASAPIPQGEYVIGEAQTSAAAGDLFSVLLKASGV